MSSCGREKQISNCTVWYQSWCSLITSLSYLVLFDRGFIHCLPAEVCMSATYAQTVWQSPWSVRPRSEMVSPWVFGISNGRVYPPFGDQLLAYSHWAHPAWVGLGKAKSTRLPRWSPVQILNVRNVAELQWFKVSLGHLTSITAGSMFLFSIRIRLTMSYRSHFDVIFYGKVSWIVQFWDSITRAHEIENQHHYSPA